MKHVRTQLRICFITAGFAGLSGGGERVLAEVANGLARRGHDVEILTYERASGSPFYPLDPRVLLVPLRASFASRGRMRRAVLDRARRKFDGIVYRRRLFGFQPLDQLAWINRFGGFWRRLERRLDAHPPDVAVAFMPSAMTALALARTRRPLRRIASTHNVPEFSYESASRDNVNPAFRRHTLAALPAFDTITVLLESHRAWYPPKLRARTVVMPNPVSAAEPGERRDRLVIAVGRLTEVKRHEILIDAWRRLADRFPRWRVEIYGDGPRRQELQARIDEAGLGGVVTLMGAVPDIEAVYGRAAVFAHPASVEGFPMAVCEALAAAVPVVGFEDCAGLNALVEDGSNGTLVTPATDAEGMAENFAAAMAPLLEDAELRERLGAAGPVSMERYSPERVLDLWEDLLLRTKAPA